MLFRSVDFVLETVQLLIKHHGISLSKETVIHSDQGTHYTSLKFIQLVEKRESIHVNTGERFVIPEHYKFSFLPDKELRELVNKPFSFFETTELRENVDFTDMDVVLDEPDIKETEDESIEEMIPEEKHLPEEEPVVFSEEEPAGQPEDEGMDTLEPVVDERSDSSGPDSPIEEVETGPDAERKKPRTKRIAVVSMFVFLLKIGRASCRERV